MKNIDNRLLKRLLHKEKSSESEIVTNETLNVTEEKTRLWVRNWVIGLGLCPWAAGSSIGNKLRIVVPHSCNEKSIKLLKDRGDICLRILEEAEYLMDNKLVIDSTLIVLPSLANYTEYYKTALIAEELLAKYEIEVQLATFHPDYMFEGTDSNSAENYTNRSPFPMVHLLQVEQVSKAIESVNGKTDQIWMKNVQLLNEMGIAKVKNLLNKMLENGDNNSSSV
eukprot:gene12989-17417_t